MWQEGRSETPAFLLYWNCVSPMKAGGASLGWKGNPQKNAFRALPAGSEVALGWLWGGFRVALGWP